MRGSSKNLTKSPTKEPVNAYVNPYITNTSPKKLDPVKERITVIPSELFECPEIKLGLNNITISE